MIDHDPELFEVVIERLERQVAELGAERDRLRDLLREAHTELTRLQLFTATREKMHPDGLALLAELCERIEALGDE